MGYLLVKMRRLFLYKNNEYFEIERMTPTLARITETLPLGDKKFFENFLRRLEYSTTQLPIKRIKDLQFLNSNL